MWVLIVTSWMTASNVGGGFYVSSVPGFTSEQHCKAAAHVVSFKREQQIQATCVPQ